MRRFASTADTALRETALSAWHRQLGARMVPFAGYSMPLQYKEQGTLDAHLWVRKSAGLFDVSHMLQLE